MESFEETLNIFDPITLDQMNEVKLLNRMDLKFTFNKKQLSQVLDKAREHYYVLIINDQTYGHYETRYFDTPDYEMYRLHHNGKKNRNKVRFRSYLDSGQSYFEVKFKTNKGRTIKTRVKQDFLDYSIHDKSTNLLEKDTKYHDNELVEAIRVYYNRITLVSKLMNERLTIDFGMNYEMKGNTKSFENLIIAEVKQDKSGISPFRDIMRELRIKNISLSKYCMGIASLVPHVKTNNFKFRLNYVNKLSNAI